METIYRIDELNFEPVPDIREVEIDFDGCLSPDDAAENFLKKFYREFDFPDQESASTYFWSILKPFYIERIRNGKSTRYPYRGIELEKFHEEFLEGREAEKVLKEMEEVGKELRIGKGVNETVRTLKENGKYISIVSATFSEFIRPCINSIQIFARDLNIENGYVGPLKGRMVGGPEKVKVTKKRMKELDLKPEQILCIDDGTTGVDWFLDSEKVGYNALAFNPNSVLLYEISNNPVGCYIVISDNFKGILPVLGYDENTGGMILQKNRGTIIDQELSGVGDYSKETGKPVEFDGDNLLNLSKDATMRYKLNM